MTNPAAGFLAKAVRVTRADVHRTSALQLKQKKEGVIHGRAPSLKKSFGAQRGISSVG